MLTVLDHKQLKVYFNKIRWDGLLKTFSKQ